MLFLFSKYMDWSGRNDHEAWVQNGLEYEMYSWNVKIFEYHFIVVRFRCPDKLGYYLVTNIFYSLCIVLIDLAQLMGIQASLPVLDRHSPLSYSIAQHVHWTLAPHRGVETCNRVSLKNLDIIQGAGLYREISENCLRCAIKRKRSWKLTIAPPFYFAQMYVQGRERNNRSGLKAQV